MKENQKQKKRKAHSGQFLFSYVVDHDTGYAPNPEGGLCSLVQCKFSTTGTRKNIVESAKEGDWIIGTGGANTKKSSGNGTLLYAMQVTEKLSLKEYCKKFKKRKDAVDAPGQFWRQALISRKFYYLGKNAKKIPSQFEELIKKGPNYRKFRIDNDLIKKFINWIEKIPQGKTGEPCMSE